MPMMPPRKCHGCGRMVVGPCEDCARERAKRVDVKRNTTDYRALYRTEKWKQTSRRHLALHPWCVGFPAGSHGTERVLAQCTDHIRPAHRYPELFFEPSNHQSLCFDCNTSKGGSE